MPPILLPFLTKCFDTAFAGSAVGLIQNSGSYHSTTIVDLKMTTHGSLQQWPIQQALRDMEFETLPPPQ